MYDELEKLFKIFSNRIQNSQKNDLDLEGYDSGVFFKDISKFYGYNALPQVLEDAKYDAIDLPSLYHGFGNSEIAKKYMTDENFITDYSFLYNGLLVENRTRDIFSPPSLLEYIAYADNLMMSLGLHSGVPETKFVPIKLAGRMIFSTDLVELTKQLKSGSVNPNSSAMLSEDDIIKLNNLLNFTMTIDDKKLQKKFLRAFIDHPSNLAVYLGYDVIMCDKFEEGDNAYFLNRGKSVIKQSDYEKYCGKNEKSGGDLSQGSQPGE